MFAPTLDRVQEVSAAVWTAMLAQIAVTHRIAGVQIADDDAAMMAAFALVMGAISFAHDRSAEFGVREVERCRSAAR